MISKRTHAVTRSEPASSWTRKLALKSPVDVALVLVQCLRPVEIRLDCGFSHLVEHFEPLMEKLECLVRSFAQVVLIEWGEQEASSGCLVTLFIPQTNNRILQAASLVHNRKCAILLCVQLRQATRLIERGH